MQSQVFIRGLATAIVAMSLCATTVVAVESSDPKHYVTAGDIQLPVPPRPTTDERAGRGYSRSTEQPLIVTVTSGDSLHDVATSQGVTLQRLFDANPQVHNPNLIEEGMQLRIPDSDEQLQHRPFPAPPAPEPPAVQQPSAPAPPPVQPPASEQEFDGGVWDRLAQCESGGNWQANTGNGYYGGLQFHPNTWRGFGGHQHALNAHLATREQQIEIAKRTQASQGWGAWPACSRKLGLR